uniref:allantoinase n=1 Tax=Xenopsylla cheopis TaxID=163159 RepID=A0A6M2DYL9_XENCH
MKSSTYIFILVIMLGCNKYTNSACTKTPPLKIFRSRKVLLSDGTERDAGIVVDSTGRISSIIPGEEVEKIANASKVEILDYGQYSIWPGVVDSHVHVNEPGRESWEGYTTATKAAAWGGITTIVDMPLNSIPPTTTLENLRTKINSACGKTHVDVAFWGGVIPGNAHELLPLINAGVRGFKCFTSESGVDEFPQVTRKDLEAALKELQKANTVLLYHAEFPAPPIGNYTNVHDIEKYQTYLETRPPSMEVNAIDMVIDLTKKYKVKSHIVHLSAAGALPALKKARSENIPLSVETCHHYLTFAAEKVPDGHTEYKCAPPIREESNREELWKALKNKDIDMVVSDHSPSPAAMKGLCNGCHPDFLKAWGGIAGLQFGLSLLWTGASKRGYSAHDVSRLLSEGPAKLTGLDAIKGQIKEGLYADLVILDPEEEFVVTKDIIQHKNKETPYLGMTLKGKVHATIVRGEFVYRNGQPFETPRGNLVM